MSSLAFTMWPIPLVQDEWQRFQQFHDGRCALCGSQREAGLVQDHCHWTGLVRGMLCRSCNVLEGVSDHPSFGVYRDNPPALVLGYRKFYAGRDWPYGWWDNLSFARYLTQNRNWTKDVKLGPHVEAEQSEVENYTYWAGLQAAVNRLEPPPAVLLDNWLKERLGT